MGEVSPLLLLSLLSAEDFSQASPNNLAIFDHWLTPFSFKPSLLKRPVGTLASELNGNDTMHSSNSTCRNSSLCHHHPDRLPLPTRRSRRSRPISKMPSLGSPTSNLEPTLQSPHRSVHQLLLILKLRRMSTVQKSLVGPVRAQTTEGRWTKRVLGPWREVGRRRNGRHGKSDCCVVEQPVGDWR